MKAQQEQQKVETGMNQLKDYLAKPEVSAVVKSFDARLGKEGAFMNEVLQRAAAHEARTKQSMSVEEAVQDFMKLIAGTPQTSEATASTVLPPQAEKKPHLPSIS